MFIENTSIDGILAALEQLEMAGEDSLLLLIAEAQAPNLDELVAALNERGMRFAGGIFPAVLSGSKRHDVGAVAIALPSLHAPILVRDLSGPAHELPKILSMVDGLADLNASAITIIDGLAPCISNFLTNLYGQLGNAVSYVGGGAGSLSLEPGRCVFSNEGAFQDAAVLVFTRLKVQLGVRHGWKRLAGPFAATRAGKNTIEELNWRPAFDVYREQVEKLGAQAFGANNFFDVAKGFPFGLIKEGQEDVVRDPLSRTEHGSLVCVGDVPENAVLSILRGSPETLIEAASQAADDALPPQGASVHTCLLMDCVSRAIFLEDKFSEELQVIREHLVAGRVTLEPEGALTLGEVSSRGDGYLEFFNKTAVLGTLYDPGS